MAHVHELGDDELNKHFKSDKLYGGAISDDELPKLNGRWFICLMSSKAHPNNGHWTLVYDVLPDKCLYFDSMGLYPPPPVQKRMVETGKSREYSSLSEQSLPQIDCGLLCAYVATLLRQKIPFERILRFYLHPSHFADNQSLALHAWLGSKKNTTLDTTSSRASNMPAKRGGTVRKSGGGMRRKTGGTVRHHAKRCGHKTLDGGSCKNHGHCVHHHKRH